MDRQRITALYCRLSNEDTLEGERNSISNQRAIPLKYAQEHGFQNIQFFIDDGYTGTNFTRPAMQELLSLVEAGSISIAAPKARRTRKAIIAEKRSSSTKRTIPQARGASKLKTSSTSPVISTFLPSISRSP